MDSENGNHGTDPNLAWGDSSQRSCYIRSSGGRAFGELTGMLAHLPEDHPTQWKLIWPESKILAVVKKVLSGTLQDKSCRKCRKAVESTAKALVENQMI